MAEQDRLVAIFRTRSKLNKAKTADKGRPIFDEMEVCEIRFAGDRNRVGVFPAHAFSKNEDRGDGTSEPVTYAQRFPDQYKRFKQNKQQVQEGTPLEELPFIKQSKRMELKALNIHTAETLAALDGEPLKTLGMGGRELKNQATAYLENASGSADVTRLAAENEQLRAQLATLQSAKPVTQPVEPAKTAKTSDFDDWEDSDIKEFIKSETGTAPRGNPNHDTLVGMADEIEARKAEADAKAED